MNDQPSSIDPQIREALEELEPYLSDSIPPLFFAGSVRVLLQTPPELVSARILAWSLGQQSPGGPLPTADYIFDAAKKIHLLAELELLPNEAIKEFLATLRQHLLAGVPETDRHSLAADLDQLDVEVSVGSSSGVDVVYRRAQSETATNLRSRSQGGDGVANDEELCQMSRSLGQGLQKLDLLLSRIQVSEPAATGCAVPPRPAREAVAANAVSQAAVGLQNAQEMEKFLDGLKRRGLPSTAEGLMGLLANNLPDWAPPPVASQSEGESPQGAVRAMRQFIFLAQNQEESQKRFDELVDTAVGEFNKESLGKAVTLLDLAGSMAAKREVDSVYAQSVQRRAHSKIDSDLLRKAMGNEEKYHLLRRFISFFHQYDPPELLLELEKAESRDRRRYLLDLLTVHGPSAREAAFTDLTEAAIGDAVFPWYYKRNLLRLLRSIPRDSNAPIETEIEVLVGLSDPTDPLPLLRETLAALGQLHHDRAVTALAAQISEIEEALTGKRELHHEPDQLRLLLDSTIKSLVRTASPEARRVVVGHGLKKEPELGNTLERLSWLADQDMGKESDLVDRIVRAIRAELPRRVFGLTLKTGRKEYVIDSLIKVLARTDTPAVRETLQEVIKDLPGQPFTANAESILQTFQSSGGKTTPAAATLSGDLELFGLPNLLQNLADSQIGGVLTVFDREGGKAAEIWLEKGKILGARGGRLQGGVAVLQLLQDPTPGRFELGESMESIPHEAKTEEQLSMQSILFEGIRRYDEFNRAATIVPDDSRFVAAGGQPSLPDGESDAVLIQEVWRRAVDGQSPAKCEVELPVDRFRVRRMFEHWVGEGVLTPAPSPETS